MSWARLDDQILDNHKILRAGVVGFALHIAAITHCARNLTDGYVVEHKVNQLLDLSGLYVDTNNDQGLPWPHDAERELAGGTDTPTHAKVANWLVAIGLWERVPGGYVVHDYLEYNPSRDEVLALREAKSAAGRKGGQASAQARAQAPAQAESKQRVKQNPTPVPVPVPVVSLKELQQRAERRGVAPDTIAGRLDGLRQLAEGKGAKHWIPYVLVGYKGGASLFDQAVSEWLAEDHRARLAEEKDRSYLGAGLLKRMPA